MGTADTRELYTRHYIHHEASLITWVLQTPDTIDTSRHHGHCRLQGTIYETRSTPQGTMDTMCAADTMQPYTRHYGCHQALWTPWALQTPGNHTPHTMGATRHHGYHGHCRHQGIIHQTLCTLQGTMDTMDTAYTMELYTRHYQVTWALQTPGYHTPDKTTTQGTMDTMGTADTRHYGCHQTQWALQTAGNHTLDTKDTNTMGTVDSREQYTRHYGHNEAPWTLLVLQTPGNHSPYMDTTRHHVDHEHCRH